VCVHREFSHKSVGERTLKISPRLPKLLSNIRWLHFLRHTVVIVSVVIYLGVWRGIYCQSHV